MNFSSLPFLYIFLPLFVITCFIFKQSALNLVLVIASLAFYAWGDLNLTLVLLFSILLNYLAAFLIHSAQKRSHERLAVFWLGAAVAVNLGLLIGSKYAVFLTSSWNFWINPIFSGQLILPVPDLPVPLGVSFFTFSAISYLVDIFRRSAGFEKNPLNVSLYITFFPKLLAGPLVQYRQMKEQIDHRSVSVEGVAWGVRRFIIGLAKKVIIADSLGVMVDRIFAVPTDHLTASAAWLGCIAFSLQIYFDFSGYSDMAIGLARAAGFNFGENFNYPISPVPFRSSGGAGIFPFLPGFAIIFIYPWAAAGVVSPGYSLTCWWFSFYADYGTVLPPHLSSGAPGTAFL